MFWYLFCRNPVLRKYALPNYHTLKQGRVVTPENEADIFADDSIQVLPVGNERFVVPELYFNPSDIGLNQAGVPEAIEQAIAACPAEARKLLEGNVLVTGGNSQTPGLLARLQAELGEIYAVRLTQQDPIETPLLGAMRYYSAEGASRKGLTKAEYEERGGRRG